MQQSIIVYLWNICDRLGEISKVLGADLGPSPRRLELKDWIGDLLNERGFKIEAKTEDPWQSIDQAFAKPPAQT